MLEDYDFIISGAGVIGLSVARSLNLLDSKSRILVLEKENKVGLHASGRNSGVIHAGFYYSANSLKAKFCLEGNQETKDFCAQQNIPVRESGKVVVASEHENEELEKLYERGIQNGVNIFLLDESELKSIEPLAKTFRKFIWSPTTSITDPKLFIEALFQDCIKRGIHFNFCSNELRFDSDSSIVLNSGIKTFKKYINCAGIDSLNIARAFGLGGEYEVMPFLGSYRINVQGSLPLKRLVYPVPHPINPFLGVHLTPTIGGHLKIGPTAIPVISNEQYSLSRIQLRDIPRFSSNLLNFFNSTENRITQLLVSELPNITKAGLLKKAKKLLVHDALRGLTWSKYPSGIRGQIINTNTGAFEQDFIIRTAGNTIHVLNVVSPGWTSALPFGRYIAKLAHDESQVNN